MKNLLCLLHQAGHCFSAIILVTHDLGVVAETADDVLLMYAGKAIEYGSVRDILQRPEHPYAWGLLSSIPRLTGDPDAPLLAIPGAPPSLISVPTGCSFHPRCTYVDLVGEACRSEIPMMLSIAPLAAHQVRCHLDSKVRENLFAQEIAPTI